MSTEQNIKNKTPIGSNEFLPTPTQVKKARRRTDEEKYLGKGKFKRNQPNGEPRQHPELTIHRWKPGDVPNPGGKPKGKLSVTNALNSYLVDNPHELTAIIKAIIKEAKMGNISAVKEIMDRIDGKVAEVHRIDSENPVTLVFTPALALNPAPLPPLIEDPRVIEGEVNETKKLE